MDRMDSKQAADKLRALADQIEKTDNLQGVAIILPPEGNPSIEIILAGSPQNQQFASYVINQIGLAAAPPAFRGAPGVR